MAGVEKLRKIQLGLETNKGTAVAATAMWRGLGEFRDSQEVVTPDEDVGYLVEVDRSYVPKVLAEFELEETPATFEQLPYPLAAGVGDVVSGAGNGGTSDGYNYVYTVATTALPTTKAYTFEGGDNQQAEEYEYCQCKEINLSGAPGQVVMMSSSWFGRQVTKTTFTSLTPPTVEEILFQKGKLYLNAVGDAITTQLTNTWLGFDLKIVTGLGPGFHGDGNLYYSSEKSVGSVITGSITFEHDAIGVARKDDFVAQTTRKFRMEFLGSALAGSGGTFANKALRMDFAAKILTVDPLGRVDGNDIVKINFEARYNATANLYFVTTVCNKLAALT
jgi:hypothetical protein